jgi:hypothetical protein
MPCINLQSFEDRRVAMSYGICAALQCALRRAGLVTVGDTRQCLLHCKRPGRAKSAEPLSFCAVP